MTDKVKEDLIRGRTFLRKFGLSKTYKLAYIDKRPQSSANFRPYFTITKYDKFGHGKRLLSARTMNELMRTFIGENKQFRDAWNNTVSVDINNHPNTDVKYKVMLKCVKELGIDTYRIKKTTDERKDIGIGRCYGFYLKILNTYELMDRSLEITDFINFIYQRDMELAMSLKSLYSSELKKVLGGTNK